MSEKIMGETQPFDPAPQQEPEKPSDIPPKKEKTWLWIAGVILVILLIGGAGVYYAGIANRQAVEKNGKALAASTQYQLGLADLAASRYAMAKQRFEYVIQLDPAYPGVLESMAKLTIIMNATATPTAANTQTANTAVVSTAVQADIYFAKKTSYNFDGSIALVEETWADPETHDKRLDYIEPIKGTNTLQRTGGAYVLENGAKYIKVTADAQGNLTGSIFDGSPLQFSNMLVCEKQEYINENKEGTRRAGWNEEGTIKAADGTELIKLSRTDISTMPGDTGKSYIENVYLDKDSGLPVKGDLSVEKDGVTSLVNTYVYTFDNVRNDGSLFDISGMNLKDIQNK
jgi:hypothetical protein